MNDLLSQVTLNVNEKVFLKNPDSSDLGKLIVQNSIELIDEIGFDTFTFKKLGQRIGSPESTIYRYFENKHKILLYLTSWYWGWLEYRLVLATVNITSNEEKLKKAIELLTETVKEDSDFSHINEVQLSRILNRESSKAYLTKAVDTDNKDGIYKIYKRLVQRVADIVHSLNPEYEHPRMLISTVIEGAQRQKYFSQHLPSLTDARNGDKDITDFFTYMVFKAIEPK